MSYDMIDRFLRNNLGDDDYAEYSAALDSLCAPHRTWVHATAWRGLTDEEIAQGQKESWVSEQAWQSAAWWAEEKLKAKNSP